MIGKRVWVSCDGYDGTLTCDEEFGLEGRRATVTQVRMGARREGWTIGSRDLCPGHKAS